MELEHRLALGQNSVSGITWGIWQERRKTILSRNRGTNVFLLTHTSRPEIIISDKRQIHFKSERWSRGKVFALGVRGPNHSGYVMRTLGIWV